MVGRLYNKAKKKREMYELRAGARERQERYAFEQRIREVMFARMIDTPGLGYLRLECLCGHKVVMQGPSRGDVLRCSKCNEGRRSAIWPRYR